MSAARLDWVVKESASADAASKLILKKRAPCMKPPDKGSVVRGRKPRAWYSCNISKMLQFAGSVAMNVYYNQQVTDEMLATATADSEIALRVIGLRDREPPTA
jgi:hypothetical protein